MCTGGCSDRAGTLAERALECTGAERAMECAGKERAVVDFPRTAGWVSLGGWRLSPANGRLG